MVKMTTLDCNNYATNILQSLYKSQKHCDVTIIAGESGKRLNAHKSVLSAASDYFDSMFSGAFVEAHQHDIHLYEIQDNVLNSILEFIYGKAVCFDNAESVLDILRASNLLKIGHVEKCCWDVIKSNLDTENAVDALLLAEQLGNTEGFKSVLKFISNNFNTIREMDGFCNLSLHNMKAILSSNDLKVKSEQDVFESMRKWTEFDNGTRIKFIPELIQFIRLPLLNEKFILENMIQLCSDEKSSNYIQEGLEWHNSSEFKTTSKNQNIHPRKSLHGKILAISCSSHQLQIHTYCPLAKIWTDDVVKEEGNDLADDSFCVWNESLILFTDVIRQFSFRTDRLEYVTSFPSRNEFATAELNGSLYVIGGRRRHVLSLVQRLDPVENTWEMVPPMATERENPGAVVLDGNLYVIGGWSSAELLDTVECYNPERNTWTRRVPLNEPRFMAEVVVNKNVIYVFGGYQGLDYRVFVTAIEKYNREAHNWAIIGHIEDENMMSISAVSHEDRIYLLKDTDDGALFGEYLPETDTFMLLNRFPYEPNALNIKYAKLFSLPPWSDSDTKDTKSEQ